MGEKGVGKLSQETPPPREGEPMGAFDNYDYLRSVNDCKAFEALSFCSNRS